MKLKLLYVFVTLVGLVCSINAQTNAPSIQSGVTFQWSDTQTGPAQAATISSITVDGVLYLNFGIPTAYDLTQLGPDGDSANKIRENGVNLETTSASSTWNASALTAFQDLNLNHYFNSSKNGRNICDNYTDEATTTAQRQTLSYQDGILATSSGIIAVTERNANNCLHIELFGIPLGGGAEQSLGETFVNETTTQWGFGGTGRIGPNGIGTPGALNPPNANSDYWLSDRVLENDGTLGIALFFLDDIAPNGSLITKAQLTATTNDHADGKLFIFTLEDEDADGYSDVDDLDDDNDGIKDIDESDGIDPSGDHDTDGVQNYKDSDFCTLNSHGICENLDPDNDGVPNHFDLDSDNDGITDVYESGGTDDDNDGEADGSIGNTAATNGIPSSAGTGTVPINTDGDIDGSGNLYLAYDFLDIDSDNDGIPDNIEGQRTNGYILPNGTVGANGIDNNYSTGLVPEDTDLDGIPDYIDLDSDNDGTADEDENGLPTATTNEDVDVDGLINPFETTNINDAQLDVNEDIEDPTDLSILPDADGDLASGGDLDYRDTFSSNPPSIATIDFDGVDDYLSRASFINGLSDVTIMAWVKSDSGNATDMVIAGEDTGCKLWLEGGNVPKFTVKTAGNSAVTDTHSSINQGEWHHITGRYTGATGEVVLFVDGEKSSPASVPNTGAAIENTSDSNGNFEIGRLSSDVSNKLYFKGDIDEVRVFDVALTDDQIQQMVYQEIEESSSAVQGKSIIKAVQNISDGSTVSWSNLIAYYPMTDIVTGKTMDFSSHDRELYLNHITSIQEQTAPMPFLASNSGSWTSQSTWAHGDVWDIETPSTLSEHAIVQISNNVTIDADISLSSLIIDSGATLTVQNDHYLENTWLLSLEGDLDLESDSQLLQTTTSDLVTSADGKVKRRQEGASSAYWYNYWASPVGVQGATSLTDNNTSSNNANNSTFSLNMLRDESGFNMNFTSGYTASGNLSSYWLFTFVNGITYWDWAQISTATGLAPGVGYTQKGSGVAGSEQQYIFQGKPNNGTILIPVEDVGGAGSETGVSKTQYLLGNPYPSALDVEQFIDDNAGVIDGTLQLWQQWSGSSHNLRDYNGGYAQLTKLGAVRAKQFVGFYGETTGGEVGTSIPSKYLPVGQGFITEIIADGNVEFNNGQRVFIKESDADGSFENGSVFMKVGGKKSKSTTSKHTANTEKDDFKKIRLELTSVEGPELRKELLLGFSQKTTDGFDYGYDAESDEENNNDLNLDHDGKNMNIAAYGELTESKVVPLNFRSSGDNTFEIRITDVTNIEEDQEIYLRDNLTGEYFDLTTNQPYRFTSAQGIFNNRLEIVFRSEAATLSNEELIAEENYIYHNRRENILYAKKMNGEVTKFTLYNIKGQSVMELSNVDTSQLQNGLQLPSVATGTYVACFRVDNQQVVTHKIVIN